MWKTNDAERRSASGRTRHCRYPTEDEKISIVCGIEMLVMKRWTLAEHCIASGSLIDTYTRNPQGFFLWWARVVV